MHGGQAATEVSLTRMQAPGAVGLEVQGTKAEDLALREEDEEDMYLCCVGNETEGAEEEILA